MIFAFFDYIQYRRRAGRYSDEFLRGKGFLPADKVHFRDPSRLRCGHIMFYHGMNSFLSWLVMYYTDSFISHCAHLVEDGYLVDCTTSGVIKHPFADYLDGKGYICIRTPMHWSEEYALQISEHAHKGIGRPYGWGSVLCLFFYQVTGQQPEFKVRWLLDFLVALLPIMYLSYVHFPTLFWLELMTLIVYWGFVSVNRWKMRRTL